MSMTIARLGSVCLLALAAGATAPCVRAQPAADAAVPVEEYYFYHARDYGSESLVNPLRLITNGGFGILQIESRSNQLDEIHWRDGWRNLWKNLGSPLAAIEQKGWWDFLSTEVIPVSINGGNAQYWPNYMNHLLGGGMSYRLMREWYRYHGVRGEVPWALATLAAYHVLNETVEMDDKTGWRVDPIADMYIFNVAGVLVFSSDGVCRFFARTLHLADWSLQPFYDPRRGRLENAGQNYMIRLGLRRESPWYLFYHWGNSGELGLSRRLGGGHHLSGGAGFVAKNLRDVDGISETVDLATTFGLFWDRDGSLLASALYSREKDNRWRFNLYPGVLEVGPLRPGLTFIVSRQNDLIAGVTFGSVPMVPVGLGAKVGDNP